MTCYRCEARDEATTERWSRTLADLLPRPATLALVGPLGAGKTRFARALGAGLGVDPHTVTSPTFTLVHEYRGRRPVWHVDAYRLQSGAEFLDLGLDELLVGDAVLVVEWADRVAAVLPNDLLRVEIEPTGVASRGFTFTAHGPASAACLAALISRLEPGAGDEPA